MGARRFGARLRALPHIAKNRLQAAKPLLLKAWEQDPSPLTGLYLAQTAARSGGAKQVPAYLAPFIDSIAAKTDPDQIQIALKTLLEVSETLDSPDAVLTLLGKLDKLTSPTAAIRRCSICWKNPPDACATAGKKRPPATCTASCSSATPTARSGSTPSSWSKSSTAKARRTNCWPISRTRPPPSSSAPARKAGARSARAAPPPPSPPSRKSLAADPDQRACAGCCSTPT
jgi:hypothetical protein